MLPYCQNIWVFLSWLHLQQERNVDGEIIVNINSCKCGLWSTLLTAQNRKRACNTVFWIPERKIMVTKALPSAAAFTEGYDQTNNFTSNSCILKMWRCKISTTLLSFTDNTSVFRTKSRTSIKSILSCKLVVWVRPLWNRQGSYGTWHSGYTAPAPAFLLRHYQLLMAPLWDVGCAILSEYHLLCTYIYVDDST